MIQLSKRIHRAEQLDNLGLSGEALHRTLGELKRINQLLGNTFAMRTALYSRIAKQPYEATHIVDLGCGGGDVLIKLAQGLQKQGIHANLTGLDGNPHSIAIARQQAQNFPEVQFETADILDPDFQLPSCDFLISSHFCYHFSDEQFSAFLKEARKRVRLGIIISELQRSRIAYLLFSLFAPLAGLGPISRKDGRLAIRRAFRRKELTHILSQANIETYSLKWVWAFRYLLIIQSPHNGR